MGSLRLEGVRPLVLAPVSLSVDRGELVFVSGPSGVGKSLLLRAVADLDPHGGEVWLDAQACSGMAPSHWRRRVGLLPAEASWWTDAVGGHFPVPIDPGVGPRGGLEGAIRGADLIGLLAGLGFEPDVLEWSVARLSTGERQRLALARLLAQGPEALLLDEATANLDPSNRERVESVVNGYRTSRAAAVLWVSHDPEQRRRLGGRQFVITDGHLAPMHRGVRS
jgi:putative ABC transport system ATP-binding protein